MEQNTFDVGLTDPPPFGSDHVAFREYAAASILHCMDVLIVAATSLPFQRHQENAACDLLRFEHNRANFLSCIGLMPLPFQRAVEVARKLAGANGKMDFNRLTNPHRSAHLRWVAEFLLEGGCIEMVDADIVFLGDLHSISVSAFNIALQITGTNSASNISTCSLERTHIEAIVPLLQEMGVKAVARNDAFFLKAAGGEGLQDRVTLTELLGAAKLFGANRIQRSRIADPGLYREMLLDDAHQCITAFLSDEGDVNGGSSIQGRQVPMPTALLREFHSMLAEYY